LPWPQAWHASAERRLRPYQGRAAMDQGPLSQFRYSSEVIL
jgi:hypothetical protein